MFSGLVVLIGFLTEGRSSCLAVFLPCCVSVSCSRHPNRLLPAVFPSIATRACCDNRCVRSPSVSAISRELVTQGLTPTSVPCPNVRQRSGLGHTLFL